MACKILAHFFQGCWWWRGHVPASKTTFTAPPLHGEKSTRQNQLTLADLADQEDVNFLLLGCLPGQGSYTLKIPDIPYDHDSSNFRDLRNYLDQLPGVVSVVCQGNIETFDFVLDFATAEEAAMAFATHPTIDLGNGLQQTFQYADTNAPELDAEPSRKRMKIADDAELVTAPIPRCQICCEELRGAFVRPCLRCKAAWCYDCVRSDFETILTDPDRFPGRCCGKIIHYDVARAVTTTDEQNKYKSRFEEFSTTKPVYCANMRCSIFLPSRVSHPDERGRIYCPNCETMTCKECRGEIDEAGEHKCMASSEAAALLDQFDYKHCPRCNTAVARMFGCAHMRCRCGAHFCWDCLRPVHMCWTKPCQQARFDDGYEDGYDDPPPVPEQTGNGNPVVLPPSVETVPEAVTSTAEVAQETQANPRENANPQAFDNRFQSPTANTHSLTDEADGPLTSETLVSITANVIEQAQPVARIDTSTPVPEHEEALLLLNLFDAVTHIPEPTHFETPPDAPPHTPIVLPITAPEITNPVPTNLDGPDRDDWSREEFDFGDEPLDESFDTWGCLHNFQAISARACKEWLPIMTSAASGRLERQVDCMRCFKTIVFDEKREVLQADEDEGADKTPQQLPKKVDAQAVDQATTASIGTAHTSKTKATARKAKKNRSQMPKLYNCVGCGVVHCTECKDIVVKDLSKLLES